MNIILESSRCVGQTKRHDYILIVAISSVKRSLPFISMFDADPIVGVLDVDFREIFSASDSVQNFRD